MPVTRENCNASNNYRADVVDDTEENSNIF